MSKNRDAQIWSRVTDDLRDWIDEQAKRTGMSRSAIIYHCIKRTREEMKGERVEESEP